MVATVRGAGLSRVDEIDERLVQLLQRDARKSARALAREIGMSPGAVSERISRLEAAGVIKGYRAEIDPSALGLHIRVLIGVQVHQDQSPSDHIKSLFDIEEVTEVHIVSGQWDLLVAVQVRDGEHLKEVVLGKIWGTSGFRHSETMLLLGSYDQYGLLPAD